MKTRAMVFSVCSPKPIARLASPCATRVRPGLGRAFSLPSCRPIVLRRSSKDDSLLEPAMTTHQRNFPSIDPAKLDRLAETGVKEGLQLQPGQDLFLTAPV